MIDKNPLEEAQEAMSRIRPVFEAMFGKEKTAEIMDDMANDMDGFLQAPRTWFAKIQDIASAGIQGLDPNVLLAAVLPHFTELHRLKTDLEQKGITDDQARVSASPAATAVVEFLTDAANQAGDEPVLTEMAPIAWPSDLGSVLGTYPGPTIPEEGKPIVFETHAGTLAASIQHSAERWYRPMLSSLLRITRLIRGDNAQDATELGAIMGTCRDLWSRNQPGLLDVLYDPARIIRNSEAHRHTEIDPRAETITFTNMPRNKPPEVLGPLDKAGFGGIVSTFMNLCLDVMSAFRVAERRIKNQQQP